MADRVVVLRKGEPLAFVADACMALADAVNQTRAWSQSDHELIDAYAEMVIATADFSVPASPTGLTRGRALPSSIISSNGSVRPKPVSSRHRSWMWWTVSTEN
jgi:hypothetical protein